MVLVLTLAALVWFGGKWLSIPNQLRWGLLTAIFAFVILVQLTLPQGHPLRMATGETAELWFILGGAGLVVLGYRHLLQILRRKAENSQPSEPAVPLFSETELDRYARHIVLREIGGPGQKALKNAKVLVIGAGGLGAPVVQYLGAAGVGTIGIVDDDIVENTNLQRQVIHKDTSIGTPKVVSACREVAAQNPFVTLRPYHRRLTKKIAFDLIQEYDLVLDGTDNFETRYLVNDACISAQVPLVSGALSQWEGQLSVFDPTQGGPCYRCVFPKAPAADVAPSCALAGVLGPLPGVIGSMMATEAIKLITGAGTPLRDQMIIYDALYGESRKINIQRRDDCSACRAKHSLSA